MSFAQVVFPMPFRNSFTYKIPGELSNSVQTGVRVVCSFGRNVKTGFVVSTSLKSEVEGKIKVIMDVLDTRPIFNKTDLTFYNWLADYYLSSLGEALRNSVPYGLDVESKKTIIPNKELCKDILFKEKNKNSIKAQILELLSEREYIKISRLQKELKKKNIYSQLKSLQDNGIISVLNEIEEPKVKEKKQKFVKLTKAIDEVYELIPSLESRSPKQVSVLLMLTSIKEEDIRLAVLLDRTNAPLSSVNSLEKKGLVEVFDKEVERIYRDGYSEESKKIILSSEQKNVIKEILPQVTSNEFSTYLIHGVTGSGKTQVYIELAKEAIKQNKTVLILVPEISLTPQITSRFYNNFGEIVTVIHSRMSPGERYDSWRGIIAEKYKVVIGARSALFSPLKNIGLIVVDEEHDASYKQWDQIPKYHARDSAIIKASIFKCPVVLGSATPSIESRYNAEIGKFKLLEMKKRIDNAKLPQIRLIDVKSEKDQKQMVHIFSRKLIETVEEKLRKREGVIILQNRRGFATQVFCEDCGELVLCDNCSVSMVHHIDANSVKCHYCGTIKPVPQVCNFCGSLNLRFFGTGTQRVEDELQYHFPNVKFERVDSDSMTTKGKFSSILNQFKSGEIQILVGTQMVSKGLDFSHVTLVGVISAETTLWLPDFRADERTFQLLTQVAGRAGRSTKPGEVIIQTLNKENFVLQKVLLNDYDGFYKKELNLRHQGGYPPFTRLCLIETKDKDENNAKGAAQDLYNFLKNQNASVRISPASAAVILKLKSFYRYQVIVRSNKKTDPAGKTLRTTVTNAWIEFNKRSLFRNVSTQIDIDPQSIV